MSLWDDGQNEFLKGAVHGMSGLLMLGKAVYNTAVAKSSRGRQWHAVCAALYWAGLGLEIYQVMRHVRHARLELETSDAREQLDGCDEDARRRAALQEMR